MYSQCYNIYLHVITWTAYLLLVDSVRFWVIHQFMVYSLLFAIDAKNCVVGYVCFRWHIYSDVYTHNFPITQYSVLALLCLIVCTWIQWKYKSGLILRRTFMLVLLYSRENYSIRAYIDRIVHGSLLIWLRKVFLNWK